MASIEKFKKYAVGHLFEHNNRTPESETERENKDIDRERTVFNYSLKYGTVNDLRSRLENIYYRNRSDKVILCESVVTLPADVNPSDERKFFQAVYDFMSDLVGEENIINAVVHKDEVRPHLHLDFVPVVKGEPDDIQDIKYKKYYENWVNEHGFRPKEKLCAKDLMTREFYNEFHPALSLYVERRLGYKVSILNGETADGNRTVEEMKLERLRQQVENAQKEVRRLQDDIDDIRNLGKRYGIGAEEISLYPMMQRLDDLNNQNQVLRKIISRNRYEFTKEDLDKIKEHKYRNSVQKFNIHSEKLVPEVLSENSLVVIETGNEDRRESPQEELLKSLAFDAVRASRKAMRSEEQVYISDPLSMGGIRLVFIKADSPEETIEALRVLEDKIKNEEIFRQHKLFMERLVMDEFNIAKEILLRNEVDAEYYMNIRKDEDENREIDRKKMLE